VIEGSSSGSCSCGGPCVPCRTRNLFLAFFSRFFILFILREGQKKRLLIVVEGEGGTILAVGGG